ncbi:MAG: nicotinate-nucleotide adenylyltransferase [Cocleimonas sp.]|nr:nicotinate-nucleotide adenylyltransferase [Cocleimonas sp.]
MIGIMGGTFDPIHFGHLRPALEVCERLSLTQVRFIPCSVPPHRAQPMATARQRLKMVGLALANTPQFFLDDRELRRGDNASYSVDTLRSLLEEFDEPLALMLGADAYLGFNRWKNWREILGMANLVVSCRPGHKIPKLESWAKGRVVESAEELEKYKAGKIMFIEVTQLAISATDIRRQLLDGLSARYLMPIEVADYINKHQLYRNVEEYDETRDYGIANIIDLERHAVLSG